MLPSLPILSVAEEVNQKLQECNTLIITAEPGAGKSTMLPLIMLDGMEAEGKILMLEPRRVAAKQIAERMSDLRGEAVGCTIGYRVRFETKVSAKTRIEVLTEGIFTRMLQSNPMLEGVSVVVFDEFHERSLSADVALALAREVQQVVRPDLRIVIMSATIDVDTISQKLKAPVIVCKGKMFPVEVIYTGEEATPNNVAEQVARTIGKAHETYEGDILAFLPGQADIIRCQELLATSLGDTVVLPLYGQLSPQKQHIAISPSRKGERKVVLSTSIAETSLTIEGVRIVVDSGLSKTMVYDSRNGLTHLVTARISKDRVKQRTGRAGRIEQGVCYRLWTLATEHRMEENREPEILTADLAPTMLEVSAWGESNLLHLPWLTLPPVGNVNLATKLLTLLGAVDESGKITSLGLAMAKLPCHPRISRMLMMADDERKKALAADIAAIVEEKDPLNSPLENADINVRINLLRKARKEGSVGSWSRVARVAREYCQLVNVDEDNSVPDSDSVGLLIASAYPERIATAIDQCGHYKMANGEKAFVERGDLLSSHDWLAVAAINASTGRIFLSSPLSLQNVSSFSTVKESVSWDNKRGSILATKEQRVGVLVLSSAPLLNVSREKIVHTLCEAAAKSGVSMFAVTDKVENMQRRVATVAMWHPELELPNVETNALFARAEEWLPYYLDSSTQNITTNELKKIDLVEVLWSLLAYEQQQAVEQLAPTHIVVPTGSRIRIDYRQGAEIPVVSVRLQECFGLTDTPRVNNGKQPVLMELLSPGFKPVQLTQDLCSFWNNTYFEVRKELRRRYPKHSWPDNPLEAEATRGVKR